MPVDPNAAIEITALSWVPDFAKGLVRDFRVRWALEEAGLAYRERLFDAREQRPESYLAKQPFNQLPTYADDEVQIFESGAIVLHVAESCETLMPRDPQGRARTATWVIAALNSLEPWVGGLVDIDVFDREAEWARLRRPTAEAFMRKRLGRVSHWLGEKDFLEDRFTAGDLVMTTVLRELRHTDLVAEHGNLSAYVARCEARPAFKRALADHMAAFGPAPRPPENSKHKRRKIPMPYVEGFVCAVPAANKEAYVALARKAAPLFKEFGATRFVENWGDEVPDGKLTDFSRAVKAKEDEVVVFSWIEYPDKATRDAANEKIMSDPRMEGMDKNMPFDGMRMIYAGFEPIIDQGPRGDIGYADGMLVPVRPEQRDAYLAFSEKAAAVFLDHGAIRVVDAWGDDVPDGKVTDYKGAVKAEDGEKIVYSWIEWPSRDARVEGWKKVMEDPRMDPGQEMPFDGKRMIYGGFSPVLVA